MGIIAWIIFGALAGWIASMIMKTNEEQGAVLNIVVGIVGAVVGGWIMSLLGSNSATKFNISSLVVAVLGACVLLAVVKAVRK